MPQALIDTVEAAERLGISPDALRRWAKTRKIRHIRLPNGQLRFEPDQIDAALAPVERIEAAS